MKRIHKILAGTAGALTLIAMTAVVAAPNGVMGTFNGMGGMGGMGMMPGGMGMMQGGMGGMQRGGPAMMSAQSLSQLKTELALTTQQEPAWQSFADKAAAQAGLMQATHAQHHQADAAPMAAPEQMAQHMAAMTQHFAGMQGVTSALKDLYAVLTPEQRGIADKALGHTGRRGMGRGMPS